MTVNTLLPLACEASSLTEAQQTFGQSPYLVPVGMPNDKGVPTFGAIVCPDELADWLSMKSPREGWDKVPGGWLSFAGHVPVWGASGLRVVEKQLITIPKGTIPHQQDGRSNG